MIADAVRTTPNAAYLLVQHAILSDQALHEAQRQIAALQDQLRAASQPQPASSFLGGGSSSWSPPPPQGQGYMGPGPFSSGGGLGSFLRSAGTTAAGVAGGAPLFEGLSGLFGGHGGGGFGGFGGGGYGGPAETITNNYYSDDRDDDDSDGYDDQDDS